MAADDATDEPAEERPRVARVRYVRSGWGVLFAAGVVAGVVVLATGVGEFDTGPFCRQVAEAAAAQDEEPDGGQAGDDEADDEVVVVDPASELARAQDRLVRVEGYREVLPYSLQDEADLVIDHTEQVIAAIEALGPDPTPEAITAAVTSIDVDTEVASVEALAEIDLYAAAECTPGDDAPR